MKLGKFLALVLTVLMFTGCASVHMKKDGVAVKTAGPDQAKIVFLRHSFVGSAISASLFDVTSEQEQFVGIHENATRIEHLVSPGDHLFMVIGESADFMAASVEAGKTYYAITTPRMGVWKARFSLMPIRGSGGGEFTVNSNEFSAWNGDPLVEVGPEAEEWYRGNRASIDARRREYIVKWNDKSAEDKAERSLLKTDGVR